MTILVTGSAGHLGEAILRTLRRNQVPALGLDVKPSPFTDRVGSIVDGAFVSASMRGVTAVVHAATLHKPHVATHSWQDFIDTNVTGTLHLLDTAVAAGAASFIYVSTTSVFGTALLSEDSTAAAWVTEDLVPRPKADDVDLLGRDAPAAVSRVFPGYAELYAARGWRMFPRLDRVYSNDRARRELGWSPRYDFRRVLHCLASQQEFRSGLALEVGSKGYHERTFEEGPYPVE